MTPTKKPVHTSKARTSKARTSKARAATAPAATASVAPDTGPVARYTWDEIRARVPAADADTLACYPVVASPNELIKVGATLRSERILSDLRLWLGEIIDWWSRLSPDDRATVVGFSDARLQVVTHHAFVLLDLVERAASSHPESEHAAAVAVADAAYRSAQTARQLLRAVLDQAASASVGFAEQVAAADASASNATTLDRTLNALIKLAREALEHKGPVAKVLKADGLTIEALNRYAVTQSAMRASYEKIRGAAGSGPVAQSTLDQQDGLLLIHMEALRKTFRAFRANDRGAPKLIARSTINHFGRTSKTHATAKPTKNAPGGP